MRLLLLYWFLYFTDSYYDILANLNRSDAKRSWFPSAVHENSGERLQSVSGGEGVPSEGPGAVAVVGRLAEIKDDDYRVCSFMFRPQFNQLSFLKLIIHVM